MLDGAHAEGGAFLSVAAPIVNYAWLMAGCLALDAAKQIFGLKPRNLHTIGVVGDSLVNGSVDGKLPEVNGVAVCQLCPAS